MLPIVFRALALAFSLCLAVSLFAQDVELYSRARVWTPATSIKDLAALGICVDHGHYRKGVYLECDFSETEIAKMRGAGFTVDILIEDVTAFYAKRGQEPADSHNHTDKAAGCGTVTAGNYPTPLGFTLGSMAGFFTYQEMLDHLDSMASQFPDLITARQPIDTFLTHQGRPIYSLRMTSTANPGINKPQVLYTAVHHAREPASMSQLIFYMYYMLENYGTDAEVTYILDNAELVFVPCLNPDGYLRNQQTNPNGGGFWRKNRRDNGGSFGVDLNRNYGYEWGYDNTGSSPDPANDTYRGPAGFSEPETQAIRHLCIDNDFKVAINHHTYGNLLIYPWGFEPGLLTPDSTVFIDLAKWMTKENGFVYGTGDETVGYTTNGDSDDWMYGEQVLKGKTFALTPESGDDTDGFWPAQSRIIPICASNVYQNLVAARFLLNYGVAKDLSASVLPALTGTVDVSLTRMGLDDSAPLTVSLEAVSNNVASVSAAQVVTSLASFDTDVLTFGYTLNSNAQPGETVTFRIVVDNGTVAHADTITKFLGPTVEVLADAANTTAYWTGGWNTTANAFVSAPFSFTDSPNGNYAAGTTNIYTLDTVVDLSNAIFAQLQYHAQWDIEAGYDYAQVQASVPGSNVWRPLCGKYTKPGSGNQDVNQPVYDGNSNGWVLEEIDLGDYVGDSIRLRFRLVSDNFVEGDGFYFDDLKVLTIAEDTTGDSTTAVMPVAIQSTWLLYPNPAQDKVVVAFAPAQTHGQILVTDLLGAQVAALPITKGQSEAMLQTAQLPVGVYLVRYEVGNGQVGQVRKLVISR